MNNSPMHAGGTTGTDVGLRRFLLGTFQYMAAAMVVSGAAAWLMSQFLFSGGQPTSLYATLYYTPLKWALWLAPMAFVWIMGANYSKLSPNMARFTLFGYAALIGVWLSSLLMGLTQTAPELGAKVFFLSIALFGSFCLFGYTTKMDLGKIGPMAAMAFFGVVIAMVINIAVFKSTGFDMILSGVGLLLMAAITAWNLQDLKQQYYMIGGNAAEAEKASAFGALSLYTSFINIFLMLLRFMGNE